MATQALLGAIGMAGEVGECTEPVKKWFFHRKGTFETVRAKLKEELGDVLWYCALLAKAFDLDLQEIADNNIAKLMARYPPPLEKAMADALDPEFKHHEKK
jgi:NTP pyrophosphatase (non-canonical NTP hydrolase)